jgi:NADH:ubiquinone oxidoreductase subunit 5 (subunit L)/multisubunit Na+/H+ antiporter MnhA subunit
MPATAVLFGVGCGAIAALPPLNGFVSEWLLLQGLVGGGRSAVTDIAIAMPIAVVAVALTAGLVAATFVKAFGTGFLAQPRSAEAMAARESAPTMVVGMGVLAVACVALGVGAPALRVPIANVATTLGLARDLPLRWPSFTLGTGVGSMVSPLLLGAALVMVVAALAIVRRSFGGAPRRAEAWGCGRTNQTARMEYTATSFAEPVQRVFDDVLRPNLDLEVTHKAESEWFVSSVRFHRGISDSIERRVYLPVISVLRRWGVAARIVQSGSVHRYLAYVFAAVVVVLVVAR